MNEDTPEGIRREAVDYGLMKLGFKPQEITDELRTHYAALRANGYDFAHVWELFSGQKPNA